MRLPCEPAILSTLVLVLGCSVIACASPEFSSYLDVYQLTSSSFPRERTPWILVSDHCSIIVLTRYKGSLCSIMVIVCAWPRLLLNFKL